MTPNDLEILIHCHVSPTRHPRIDYHAVRESINKFIKDGIIEESADRDGPHYYTTTDKGRAWIEMILRTPYPRQVWVDEKGKVIVIET